MDVEVFWNQAQIPVRGIKHSIVKLEKLYTEWINICKNRLRKKSPAQINNEERFCSKLKDLFDIAQQNVLQQLDIEDQRQCLISQRKAGRRGFIDNNSEAAALVENFGRDEDDQDTVARNNGADLFTLDDGDSINRIIYDDGELEKLIGLIKNLTTLEGLEEVDWSNEVLAIIKDFIEIPSKTALSIYFRGSVLTAELNFPSIPVHQMTYFVRENDEIFHYENFHRKILFGTNNGSVEASVQRIMETLLAPIFFQMTTWPDSVKADFCDAFHQYLSNNYALRYKMHSLTMLYLPQEGINLAVERACIDKDLVKRLEGVVVNWTRQIRLTVIDYEQHISQDLLCPVDEHNFWIYRYKNLSGINYQLQQPILRHIVNILENADSTYVRKLLMLNKEVESGIVEAKSNIMYLGILGDVSRELNDCSKPEEVSKHVPRILHLLRFIWLNSPFYNTENKMTHLFILFHNQIILVCCQFIDLKKILICNNTRWGMRLLQRCIKMCNDYEITYLEFATAHNTLTDKVWDLDVEKIFRNVHIFIQRCHDLIEICQVSIDFARLDETTDIPVPRFGGTRGQEHQKVCIKVEKLFHEHLRLVCHNHHKILDVQEATWHDDMFAFRVGIKDLEIIIENLINAGFRNMNTVEEAIGNLYGLRMYMNRNNLKELFESIITLVWRIFSNEIQRAKYEISEEHLDYSVKCPYYAGRALNLRLRSKQLESTRHLLASIEWFDHCSIREEVNHQNSILRTSINDTIIRLYHKWMDNIGDNPKSRLDRYLMRWSVDKPRLLESNLDPYILNLCHEAHHWRYLGFQIPVSVEIIDDKWTILQFVSESVFMLVLAYNRIIQALSDEEKCLFKNLLKNLDYKITPGLRKITWSSEFIDAYIQGCCTDANNLQNFLRDYKSANMRIVKLCEEICDMALIRLKPNYVYNIHEFEQDLKSTRDATFKLMQRKYHTMIQCILIVYKGFRKVIDESAVEWRNYIINLDKVFEEALRLCLKNTLMMMYDALHGDGTTEPSPLFHLEAALTDNKIVFTPPATAISEIIGTIKIILLEPLRKTIPRIGENFDLYEAGMKNLHETFCEDEYFEELQNMLNNEISYCFTQIKLYLKSWEPFADIWEVNKDMFINRYEKLNPTVASFDADIARYTEVANNVQMQETVTTVHFLDINADRLKAAVIEHCSQWQQKLTALLLRMTQMAVDRLYKYMRENGEK